jgi:hypothetical protein
MSRDGTVDLMGALSASGPGRPGHKVSHASRRHTGASELVPGLEGLGPSGAVLGGGEAISAERKEVGDLAVNGQKALSLSR